MNPTAKPETEDRIFTLYRNVKHLREARGLSVKQLAMIINSKVKPLRLSENCENFGYLNDENIKKLCVFFSVTPNALFRKRLWEESESLR